MRRRFASRLACVAATVALAACGSSPTEPGSSSMGMQTTLRIVVTRCDLGGSVTVYTEMGMLGTFPTPGEGTFRLSPGPHDLAWKRGNETFAGSPMTPDPLASIAPGMTASITLTDPLGACSATAQ